MDRKAETKEIIVKTTLELLQNVLPTNIMSNFEQLDAISGSDGGEFGNDLDEERFFFKHILQNANQSTEESAAAPTSTADAEATESFQEPQFVAVPEFHENGEQIDNNSSLTYFEIVEQEMMQSIPVTDKNLEVKAISCAIFVAVLLLWDRFLIDLVLFFVLDFVKYPQRIS